MESKLSNAWDIKSILMKLINASEILMHDKNYDGLGWEEVATCVNEGKKLLLDFQQTPITPESLKGVGFESEEDELARLIIIICDEAKLRYYIDLKQFEFEFDYSYSTLYFASIEQLTEWLKPFTKGEGNG